MLSACSVADREVRPAMTFDGPTSPAPPPSSVARWRVRELLALVLGRDAVQAPGTRGAVADGGPGAAGGTLLPPPPPLVPPPLPRLFVPVAAARGSRDLGCSLS